MSNTTSTNTGSPKATSPSQTSSAVPTSQASVPSSSLPPSSLANTSRLSGIIIDPTTSLPTSSSIILPPTTSILPTSSNVLPTSTSGSITPGTTSIIPTSTTPTISSSNSVFTSVITQTTAGGSTITTVVTSTAGLDPGTTKTGSGTSSSSSSASTAASQTGVKATSSGLSSGGTIAVAVVVPIVAVALIILAGLYFWRKRKQRKDAEELRRKEVEEYGYNPNNDPTLPAVGAGGSARGNEGPYEMREDESAGYRGWGTTAVASSGRKASTTLSGGQSAGGIGMAYSEGTSPTHGPVSDTRSDNHLMDRPLSGEIEPLGAMGPAASGNRSTDINRGPSNASSQYSTAGRSDGSGEMGYGGGQYYQNQYDTGNPYAADSQYGSPPGRSEMPAQPIIRDVQARRNTRIENPAHFPQQSAGISQNF